MFTRILLPLDGSDLAELAIPYATELAHKFGSELVMLSVVQPITYTAPAYSTIEPLVEPMSDPTIWTTLQDQHTEDLRRYLNEVVQRPPLAALNPRLVLESGGVADTILNVAETIGADAIVMATHGRSGVSRWVMGSNADRIVHHSSIPVLLIRPASGNDVAS